MNIHQLDPKNNKFERGRAVYVLLHSDKSHIYPNPDGGPAWSYDKPHMELIQKIIKKDFGISQYHIVELAYAFPLICNKQAELEKMWKRTIYKMSKMPRVQDRISEYRSFAKRCRNPHPISADAVLKKLLGIETPGQ